MVDPFRSVTRRVVPEGSTKNAKAGEPEGSSALAREHMALQPPVKWMRSRKNAHVAYFRRVRRDVGTLPRARGEKSPHSTSAQRVQAPRSARRAGLAGVPTRPPWFYAAVRRGRVAVIAAIVIG
jgi:hypothetical protein